MQYQIWILSLFRLPVFSIASPHHFCSNRARMESEIDERFRRLGLPPFVPVHCDKCGSGFNCPPGLLRYSITCPVCRQDFVLANVVEQPPINPPRDWLGIVLLVVSGVAVAGGVIALLLGW